MVGQPDAAWNLELVGDPEDETPASPTKRTCWTSASVVTSGQRYPRQAGARPCKSGPVTREQQETGPFDDAAVAEAVRLAKSISALLQAADGHRHPARPSGLA